MDKKIAEIKVKAKTASKGISSEAKDVGKKIKHTGNKALDNAKITAKETAASANKMIKTTKGSIDRKRNSKADDHYIKDKKEMVFQSGESLQQVVNVVNEAAMALDDENRTIQESAIPEVLAGALGAGVGGVGSFAALYGLGTVGLSAVGITSGLATAGAIVGGGMVAGIFVLAAPIAALSAGGVALASSAKQKQLRQEKERLYKEALAKHEAIINALETESQSNRERMEYLESLNILLQRAIIDLQKDLGIAS